jgi:hypothetical protein
MKIRPFLSHKREDALVVTRLKATLCLYGAGGWKDTDDLRIGAHTPAAIRKTILEETGGFVWWGTRKALDSKVINRLEIPTALERAGAQPFYPLVPVFANISPSKDRVEIEEAIGEHTEDFLDRNGIVRGRSESTGTFRRRIARRYVRDAVPSITGDSTTVAFRALSAPSGNHELTFDWRAVIDERSRRLEAGSVPILLDALVNAREAFQSLSDSPRLRLDLDLPLPLAMLVGYEWRITTRLQLKLRQRTGSLSAWIDADGAVAKAPVPRMKSFDRDGPTVVAVSCKDSLEEPGRRYAEEINASKLIMFYKPGLIDVQHMRALARRGADELRALNDREADKHLLIRGPTSLAVMLGTACNACGPITLPFWDGTGYVSSVVIGR